MDVKSKKCAYAVLIILIAVIHGCGIGDVSTVNKSLGSTAVVEDVITDKPATGNSTDQLGPKSVASYEDFQDALIYSSALPRNRPLEDLTIVENFNPYAPTIIPSILDNKLKNLSGNYILRRCYFADLSGKDIANLIGSSTYRVNYGFPKDKDNNLKYNAPRIEEYSFNWCEFFFGIRDSVKVDCIRELLKKNPENKSNLFTKIWYAHLYWDVWIMNTTFNGTLTLKKYFNIMPLDLVNFSLAIQSDDEGSLMQQISSKNDIGDGDIALIPKDGNYEFQLGKDSNYVFRRTNPYFAKYRLLQLAFEAGNKEDVFRDIVDAAIMHYNWSWDELNVGYYQDFIKMLLTVFDLNTGKAKYHGPKIKVVGKRFDSIPYDKLTCVYDGVRDLYRLAWKKEAKYLTLPDLNLSELIQLLDFDRQKALLKMIVPSYKELQGDIKKYADKLQSIVLDGIPSWVLANRYIDDKQMASFISQVCKGISKDNYDKLKALENDTEFKDVFKLGVNKFLEDNSK